MPTNKDFKKLVRARAARTGESYSTARAQLLQRRPDSPKPAVVVAVTGAGGRVAYSLLFKLVAGEVFGPETPVRLRLVDVDESLPSLEGLVMELEDCSSAVLAGVDATSDYATGFDGASWVLALGVPRRRAGMERADLLRETAASFAVQGRAVGAAAAEDVRVLVVGNPANTNCLIARHAAPDVPPGRWSALLRLDHNRLRSQLARHLDVPLSAITRASVWGNHSATMVPDIWHARVDDHPAVELLDETWVANELIPAVQQRGAAVLEAAGASSAASAAAAVADEVRNLHLGSTDWISPGVVSAGEYGIPEGLQVGLPATVNDGEIRVVENLELSNLHRQLLDRTIDELCDERDQALALLPG